MQQGVARTEIDEFVRPLVRLGDQPVRRNAPVRAVHSSPPGSPSLIPASYYRSSPPTGEPIMIDHYREFKTGNDR
ncbi:hypothetical protein GCM10010417_51450 [Streptomyces carpaticus]